MAECPTRSSQFGPLPSDTGCMSPVAPPVEGRHWLTTSPMDWPDLRGRVVVVLFWSFGCEASLLAIRRLSELVELWDDEVVALAVHTPRFPYEDDPHRVAAAVAHHRIEMPVVHDPDYLTWNRYSPEGWPATAVVDRAGKTVGMVPGTAEFDVLVQAVETALVTSHARKRAPGADVLPAPNPDLADVGRGSSLRFPSGVAISESGRVAIADSGNDRLLIGEMDSDLRTFKPEMEITDIDRPRAIAFASDTVLYVIEGGTDAVLQVDIGHGTLDVLTDDEVTAPTALLVDTDGSLIIADAGSDQLIRVVGGPDGDIMSGVIAGSGFSGCRDGNAGQAELAQPVAMARTTAGVAFCDAASSNLRVLTGAGKVLTVTGNDFFDWGLVDGPAHNARLQRPGGLCAIDDETLVIADTGNDRIRILADRRLTTLGLHGLDQPTAITAISERHVLVADTGNHRVVVVDLEQRTGWPLAVYPASMTTVWDEAAPGVS